ncbi:hypothetical protein EDC96DRAFT_588878 [Choanephora cucurbitarum]|nr:hypothetical protein EDC96DRAFT_588878 [Choanephora cucurbitarum]
MGETRTCHRFGQYTPSRSSRISQKDSKKVGCTATLNILQFQSEPSVVELKLLTGHANHVPGDDNDVRTLPLTREAAHMIESQLRSGINCRDIKTAVLCQVERWEIGQRKPTYEDVYNRIRKVDLFD